VDVTVGDPEAEMVTGTPALACVTHVLEEVVKLNPEVYADEPQALSVRILQKYCVLGMDVSHTWINDLTITLQSPSGTVVTLVNPICGGQDNMLFSLDDAAGTAISAAPCPPTAGSTFSPSAALAGFNGEDPAGVWTLTISDGANQDGGTLNAWSLEICADPPCTDPVVPTLSFDTDPMCPPGGANNLNISGSLGDATQWHIYTTSCGTGQIGTNTNGTFPISTASTITYHVRGEGGCVTPGSCASATLTVGDSQNPSIACPSNINQTTVGGACDMAVTIAPATGSDNCGVASIINNFNGTSNASGTYPLGSTTVIWTITDVNGNTNSCNQTVNINSSNLAQPGTIAGATNPCVGATETYSVTAVPNATSYAWTLPGGWTGTSTTNSITVTVGASNGTISVVPSNACSTGPGRNKTVVVDNVPNQPGSMAGSANPCIGTSETYSVSAVGNTTGYTWTIPAGWTGTSTTNSITVTVGAGSGNVSVTADNACGSGTARVLAVTSNDVPGQPAVMSGEANPCAGAVETYSVASVANATSYTWGLPGGWTGSSTTNSITATVGASSGTISVTPSNACGSGTARILAVTTDDVPAQPAAISGTTTPCIGASETYSITAVPNTTSYTWAVPAGWTGTSTTNSISVTVGSSGGTISVTPNNGCGSGTAQTLTVTTEDVPTQPSAISGASNPCIGSSETYSVTADPNATTYAWSVPGGWSGTSTTNSINLTVGVSAGTISVTPSNTCGAGAARTLAVTTDDVPAQPAAISGATNPCLGALETYSVAAVPNTTTYTWSLPGGWTGSSTSNSINVTVGAAGGTISVTANNPCGSGTAQTLAVNSDDIPAQPGAISGATNPCLGASETYSIAAVPNTTSYTWTLPGGWTGTSTSNSINVTVGATGGTISVTANNACGSGTAQTLVVTSDDVPAQPGAISGASNPCSGASETYSVAAVPNTTSYTWSLPGGWTGTSTSNSINVTVGASGGTISVTPNNACGSGTPRTLAVTSDDVPAQPSAISGATNPCVSSSETYSITSVPNTASYTWSLPGGWTGSSTSNSINVTVGASAGTVSVTPNNSCGSGTARTLAVSTNDVLGQPGVISGATTVCSGDNEAYSIAPMVGSTGYTWSLPTGWTGSSTTNSINVVTGPNAGNVTLIEFEVEVPVHPPGNDQV